MSSLKSQRLAAAAGLLLIACAVTAAYAQDKPGATQEITAGADVEGQEADSGDKTDNGGNAAVETDGFDADEFMTYDDVYQSPIGAVLQHDCTRLISRQVACGLAVLEVRAGGPAAAAGLRNYSGLVHTLMGATVMGAGMVF